MEGLELHDYHVYQWWVHTDNWRVKSLLDLTLNAVKFQEGEK